MMFGRLAIALLLFFLSMGAANATCAAAGTCFWIGGTGTLDLATDSAHWSSSTGGASCSCEPTSTSTLTFDGSSGGGTVTVNATVNATAITFGAFTGTLDFSVNNNNVNLSGSTPISGGGSSTRTWKMGNGTYTLSNSSALVDFSAGMTNLTITPAGSTIAYASQNSTNSRAMTLPTAGSWFNNITIGANTSSGNFTFNLSGHTLTINTLAVTGPSRVRVSNGATLAVTSMTSTGSSTGIVLLLSDATGTAATISSASNQTFNWCNIWDLTFTGGGTFIANSSFNSGNNTGITINAPNSGSLGGGIIGGWLLARDLNPANDNWPVYLNKAA